MNQIGIGSIIIIVITGITATWWVKANAKIAAKGAIACRKAHDGIMNKILAIGCYYKSGTRYARGHLEGVKIEAVEVGNQAIEVNLGVASGCSNNQGMVGRGQAAVVVVNLATYSYNILAFNQ